MREVLAIAAKDIVLLVRDRVSLFFTLGFPVLFAVFFGAVFSSGGVGGSPVAVIVVDEDGSAESARFVERLREAPELSVESPPGGASDASAARALAMDSVRLGRRAAAIILPAGFGESSRNMFAGGRQTVELAADPSRGAEIGLLEGVLARYAFEEMGELFRDNERLREALAVARARVRGADSIAAPQRIAFETMFSSLQSILSAPPATPGAAGGGVLAGGFEPFRVEVTEVAQASARAERRRGTFAVTFAQGIMWGIAGCAAAFGLSLVVERSRGTLVRLRAAPIRPWAILAGKGLACFVATMTVALVLLAIAGVAFGVRPTAPALLVVALLCVGVCFVGLMMLLAVLGRTEGSAGSIGWAVMLVLMMLGGGAVPLFVMPGWMQTLSMLSPVRWAILAIEGGLWRQEFSAVDMVVPCAVLLTLGVVGMVAGAKVFAGGR